MKYIDQNEIYRVTQQGKLIFQHYFPQHDFSSTKNKIAIRDEKTPSAVITFYQGLWRITDYGNQSEVNSLPGVNFVMYYENLVYIDALNFIQSVIIKHEVTSDGFTRPEYKADYSWREMGKEDIKGDYKFTYKKKPDTSDLVSIGRYVDADLLAKFNCRVVEQYELCTFSKKYNRDIVHIFKSTETYPIFLFDYGSFKKLYKPHELEKRYRFSYIGDKPKNFIYGYDQLLKASNEFVVSDADDEEATSPPPNKPKAIIRDLFRCSGESDALNMASLGFHVYWLNSETANMDFDTFEMVDALCENHYQIMDLDKTGQQAALSFALQHIYLFTVYLPEWLTYKKDWRGNPCKDIKDFINIAGDTFEKTFEKVIHLKRVAMPIKFWSKFTDKNGVVSYNINMEYYYHFLKAHGFYTMDSKYHRRAGYCYARVTGKIVDLINPDDIKKTAKRFTKDWLRGKNLMDEIALLNKLNTSNQISENNLQELAEFSPEFVNCSKNVEFIHFKNASLKITPEAITRVNHDEIPNYILGRLEINDKVLSHYHDLNIKLEPTPAIEVNATPQYQELLDKQAAAKTIDEREAINTQLALFPELDRYEVKINDKDFIFARFLQDLSYLHWRKEREKGAELTVFEQKEQNLALANLIFVLGWLMAEYKDPGQPWIAYLQDMKISEVGQSSGRSGKSLYSEAIRKVRNSFYIGGRRKDITDKTEFIYDGFTVFHNNIEVDDLFEYADFNFFYTQASGKREINSKFISKQILDYKDSGKMLISSNFELQNTDSSTLARILNAGVSDYYHEKTKYNDYLETRTPLTQFGKRLYDDFTEIEWIKFYNLCAYAIQLSMWFFKIQPPMANLEKRQLRRDMTKGLGREEEFWTWANTYFCQAPDSDIEEYSPPGIGYYNRFIKKEEAYETFKATLTQKQAAMYKSNSFKKAVQSFCDYYDFELNPLDLCGNDQNRKARRIIKTKDGTSIEYLFISTAKRGEDLSLPSTDLPF